MTKPSITAVSLSDGDTEFSLSDGLITITNGYELDDGTPIELFVSLSNLRHIVEMFDKFPDLHGTVAVEG